MEEIFPLEMIYTVQKSGTPFDTPPGISFPLNRLRKDINNVRTKDLLCHVCIHIISKNIP